MNDRIDNSTASLVSDIDEQAACWDARLRAPGCTDEERLGFRAWCRQSPLHQQRFDDLEATLGVLRSAMNVPEIRAMREAALDASPESRIRRFGTQWGMALAAGMSILAAGLLWFGTNSGHFGTEDSDAVLKFTTAVGERSTRTLTDGTVAELNTNTSIEVNYSDDERLVTLRQGQSMFDVAKDLDRPFVVVAGDQRITAVGTVFDVRFENDEVKVTLVEGVVEVEKEAPHGSSQPVVGRNSQAVRLVAGEQLFTLVESTTSEPIVTKADVERETIWREGRVFFEDVPLPDAIAEMNRYNTVQIIVEDPRLGEHRVNGMFRAGRQANFVNALEAYFPVESQTDENGQILLNSKQVHKRLVDY